MSEWDKLWEIEKDNLPYNSGGRLFSDSFMNQIKAVGDKLQARNNRLIDEHNRIREAHVESIQKLEAIRPFIEECKDIMVKEAVLGILE